MDVFTHPDPREQQAKVVAQYLNGLTLQEAMTKYPQFEFRPVSVAMTADYCPSRINVVLGPYPPGTRVDLSQPIPKDSNYILRAYTD